MPFEDIYKESDVADRRRRMAIVFGLLCAAGYCGFLYMLGQNHGVDEQRQKADAAVLREKRLERVKNLCQRLPKPEQFDWANESLSEHNDHRTIILEEYKSKRISNEILPFFQIWFASNGWIRRDRKSDERWATTSAVVTTFYKDNQEISVISNDWTEFHGIECQEREVESSN